MLDSATISLSDLLVPWETIVERLQAVAAADLVVSLYNPRSKKTPASTGRRGCDLSCRAAADHAGRDRHRGEPG